VFFIGSYGNRMIIAVWQVSLSLSLSLSVYVIFSEYTETRSVGTLIMIRFYTRSKDCGREMSV
jgi:hypothetical protein